MARSPRSCPAPTTASSWLRRHGDDSPRVAPRGLPTSTAAAAAAAPLVRDCARARVCEREARTRPVQRVGTCALRRGAHMLILKCETGCSTRSSPRRSRARHSLRPRRTRRPTRQAHAAAMLVRGCARSRCGARPHVISTQSPAVQFRKLSNSRPHFRLGGLRSRPSAPGYRTGARWGGLDLGFLSGRHVALSSPFTLRISPPTGSPRPSAPPPADA